MSEHRPDILLNSGNFFNYLTPETSIITIEDIACGLSNESRYNGQTGEFYEPKTGWSSVFYCVAQHSIMVSHLVPPEHALAGLLHDCAEAVMKDLPKPLKRLLPDYCALEKIVEAAILAKFGISLPLHPSVKRADLIMLATEKRDLMPAHSGWNRDCHGAEPMFEKLIPMSPKVARKMFLHRYYELMTLASA